MTNTILERLASAPQAPSHEVVLVIFITLLILLVIKEIISGLDNIRAKQINRTLTIAIVPLLVISFWTVVVNVVDLLG